jgi:transcriptional regulator with XRE-family HTH domain
MACTSNRLAELLKANELKRHELAVELGVDPSTVWRWERGDIPTEYIAPLTKKFEVTSDHLLGLDRSDSPSQAATGAKV